MLTEKQIVECAEYIKKRDETLQKLKYLKSWDTYFSIKFGKGNYETEIKIEKEVAIDAVEEQIKFWNICINEVRPKK